MQERYQPENIEKKWQAAWQEAGVYAVADSVPDKENYYQLVEFAYPSGNLHVGHWYAFAVPDIHARFKRMKGKNVLYPMGFDAFGLPAENAAIKNGLDPKDWTYQNMDHMKKQLQSMGAMFDWERSVVTCSPEYYQWTQWLFIQLFNVGLVEQKLTFANWCPSCKTVLANEQVANNACDRCGTEIEKKRMLQWQLGITKYADRLLDDLEKLDWPEEIKTAQKNWIGRSEGAEIDFQISGNEEKITVFTTRPDTLYGVTYMVLAPEHKLVNDLKESIENWEEVEAYQAVAKKKSEIDRTNATKEKTGVELKGVKAINPSSGEEISVFVADYVLAGYGTGAIMAVPAHDERDRQFAEKFGLPIKQVVANIIHKKETVESTRKAVYGLIHSKEKGYLLQYFSNRNFFWLPGGGIEEGEAEENCLLRELIEETGYTDLTVKERLGEVYLDYISREAIPRRNQSVVYRVELVSENQGEITLTDGEKLDGLELIWVPEEKLDAVLAGSDADRAAFLKFVIRNSHEILADTGVLVASGEFTGMDSEEAKKKITEKVGGRMTKTYRLRDWGVSRQRYWGCPIPLVHCESCDWQAASELPVLLPEVENYLPGGKGESPLAKNKEFVHTTCPSCAGPARRETDTLDTFVDSSWYFLRYCDPKNEKTFADKETLQNFMPVNLYSGGAEHTTMHLLYSRFFHKALFDLGLVNEAEPYVKRMNRGLILGPDGNKMSKSKGNVIDPDAIIVELGADTMRMYLAFIGPYNEIGAYPWNPEAVIGVRRFLDRAWRLAQKIGEVTEEDSKKIDRVLHKALKEVEESIVTLKMNTGVAALMIATNELTPFTALSKEHIKMYIQILAPYAPHIAEELWHELGETTFIHQAAWPVFDESKLVESIINIPVQINGKVRTTIDIAPNTPEAEVEALVLSDEKVIALLDGQKPKRIIVIPEKIVSIVV